MIFREELKYLSNRSLFWRMIIINWIRNWNMNRLLINNILLRSINCLIKMKSRLVWMWSMTLSMVNINSWKRRMIRSIFNIMNWVNRINSWMMWSTLIIIKCKNSWWLFNHFRIRIDITNRTVNINMKYYSPLH